MTGTPFYKKNPLKQLQESREKAVKTKKLKEDKTYEEVMQEHFTRLREEKDSKTNICNQQYQGQRQGLGQSQMASQAQAQSRVTVTMSAMQQIYGNANALGGIQNIPKQYRRGWYDIAGQLDVILQDIDTVEPVHVPGLGVWRVPLERGIYGLHRVWYGKKVVRTYTSVDLPACIKSSMAMILNSNLLPAVMERGEPIPDVANYRDFMRAIYSVAPPKDFYDIGWPIDSHRFVIVMTDEQLASERGGGF